MDPAKQTDHMKMWSKYLHVQFILAKLYNQWFLMQKC